MKRTAFFLLLLLNFTIYAQIADGSYLISDGQIKKMIILNRKDGSIKLSKVDHANQQEHFIFKPTASNANAFEGKFKRDNYRLEDLNGVIRFCSFDNSRLITSIQVMARDKKSLKSAMKQWGIKSAAKLEFEAILNDKKEPIPLKREYLIKNPTSKFHEEHVTEIVFFSEKPEIGKEDPSKIRTSFKAGEAVWAIAYLPTELAAFEKLHNFSMDNFGKVTRELCIGMDKMDKNLLEEEIAIINSSGVKRLTEADLKLNYVIFQVIPALQGKHEMYKYGVEFITERLGERVESYEHTFEIALTDANMVSNHSKSEMKHVEFIKGEFQYDATGGMEGYTNFSKGIALADLEKKQLPSAAFRDADIEHQMMQQIEFYKHNKGWEVDLKRIIITSDWQILRDDYGTIKGNYIQGVVVYSHSEGCTYMNFGFLKDHIGGGSFSESLHQYDIGRRGDITCDKI